MIAQIKADMPDFVATEADRWKLQNKRYPKTPQGRCMAARDTLVRHYSRFVTQLGWDVYKCRGLSFDTYCSLRLGDSDFLSSPEERETS